MAKRRMLSKRVSQSKKVNSLPVKAQIVWTWTIPYLDDYGCYTGDPEDIKTEVFPKNKKISQGDIEKALSQIVKAGLINLYAENGKLYQHYTNFDDFQTFRADRKRQAEYPRFYPQKQGLGDNVIPTSTNDTPKLSKVKLSKEKKSKVKNIYMEFVELTDEEHSKLVEKFGSEGTKQRITALNDYIGSSGKKYKSHYHTILCWEPKPEKTTTPPVRRGKDGLTDGERERKRLGL